MTFKISVFIVVGKNKHISSLYHFGSNSVYNSVKEYFKTILALEKRSYLIKKKGSITP